MKRIFVLASMLLAMTVGTEAYEVTVDNFSISPGEQKDLNVYLTNEGEVSGFQFDIYLPEGISVIKTYDEDEEDYFWGVKTARLRASHTINANDNGSYYTFLVYSGSSQTVKATSGDAVFSFRISASDEVSTGNYTIDIKNARYSDKSGNGALMADQTCQCTIAINVTIGAAGYATFSWPRSLDFSETGLEAYIAKGDFMSNGEVTLEQVSKVPANTGLVIKGDAGTYHPQTTNPANADDVTGNQLISTASGELAVTANNIYALSKKNETIGFYPVNSTAGLKIPQYRAYLDGGNASARKVIALSGEPTIVRSVTEKEQYDVFNLHGQRVDNPSGGVYIYNGKKVVYNR